jgi:hypothetical protein
MTHANDPFFEAVKNAAATRTYRMAARFGLPAAEREDIQQELILDMLERADQFDPAPMATSNSPTFGQSNSPRQDG